MAGDIIVFHDTIEKTPRLLTNFCERASELNLPLFIPTTSRKAEAQLRV